MNGLILILIVLGSMSALLLWRMFSLMRRGRWLAGVTWSVQTLLILSLFTLSLLLFSNLYTYQRLTHEQPVGDIRVHQLGAQRYRIELALEGVQRQSVVLRGDHWRLDVRLLKWQGWANLLGLDSYYQLDRLSGRYADISQAGSTLPSLHDLRPPQRGLDVFGLKQKMQQKLPFVDAYFGQSVYMPLADAAHYRVTIGQQGLLVRPLNQSAQDAVVEF